MLNIVITSVVCFLLVGSRAQANSTSSTELSDGKTRPYNELKEEAVKIREEAQSVREEAQSVREEAHRVREEAQSVREEAQEMIERAYEMKDQVYDMRDREYAARSELEGALLEGLALMRGQATVTGTFIKELRDTMSGVADRMDQLEASVRELDNKMEEKIGRLAATTNTINERQQLRLSEVRLISLYKMTDSSTSSFAGGYDADIAVDGQLTFGKWDSGTTRTVFHSGTKGPTKLSIKLGGHFRVHRVKVWNMRGCCQERIIGTRVYADERLLGVVVEANNVYEFDVSTNDPTYASTITLHQTLNNWLHVVEVLVWGSGPYATDDMFT